MIAAPPLHARIGPLRFALCAAAVGLAPQVAGVPLPTLACEGVVSVDERGEIFLLLDHRRKGFDDGPVYAELWRPLGEAEGPLRGLLLIAPSASGRPPVFAATSLTQLAAALVGLSPRG